MSKYSSKKAATGTLYLTATHLIFLDPEGSKETWVNIIDINSWHVELYRD